MSWLDDEKIKGYCCECVYSIKNKECRNLGCLITPKFYCKDFKKKGLQ